jgi:hypothetical protein
LLDHVIKACIPVLAYAILSFGLLGLWMDHAGAGPELRGWLHLARLAAWGVALIVAIAIFLPLFLRRPLKRLEVVGFCAVAIMTFYFCDGYLSAYAEEAVIQHRTAHRDPRDDMGPNYMYG